MAMDAKEDFWGCELSLQKREYIWTAPDDSEDDIEHKLQINQACLGRKAIENQRNVIEVTTSDEDGNTGTYTILSLRLGQTEMCSLELGFLNKTTIKLSEGAGPVHLTGYHLQGLNPGLLSEDESGESDEEVNSPVILKNAVNNTELTKTRIEQVTKSSDEESDDDEDDSDESEEDKPQKTPVTVKKEQKTKETLAKKENGVLSKKETPSKKGSPAKEEAPAKKGTPAKEEIKIKFGDSLIEDEASEDEEMGSEEDDDDDDDLASDSSDEGDDEEDESDDDDDELDDDESEEDEPQIKKPKVMVNGTGNKKAATPGKKSTPRKQKTPKTPQTEPERKIPKKKEGKEAKGPTTPKLPVDPADINKVKQKLLKSPNLPKTQDKFKNFMKSAHRVNDDSVVKDLWEWLQKNKK